MSGGADTDVAKADGALVSRLLPLLVASIEPEFNLFEVMHHGRHEKQLSNIFAWLLDSEGTHRLGDVFTRIFVEEVNRGSGQQVPFEALSVRQEVDTSPAGSGADIADLVLEGETVVLVVENYYTSDGHGHNYEGYRRYGEKDGKNEVVVVLLCEFTNPGLQSDGWENAPVVTYGRLVERLIEHVEADRAYQAAFPAQVSFFRHMEHQFLKGLRVQTDQLIDFVDAMCQSGEAGYYGALNGPTHFGDRFRELAIANFEASYDLLQRVKAALHGYGQSTLRAQVNDALGPQRFVKVSRGWRGGYQWTVSFEPVDGDPSLNVVFGPSAWGANTRLPKEKQLVNADYTHLFIQWWDRDLHQSAVTLQEVLEGIPADDFRLPDEIVGYIRSVSPS